MTIQQLINILSKIENKELPVYIFTPENELHNFEIDLSLEDRIDLNLTLN